MFETVCGHKVMQGKVSIQGSKGAQTLGVHIAVHSSLYLSSPPKSEISVRIK